MEEKGPHKFYTMRGYQLQDQQSHALTPSLEDYLEMIFRSMQKGGAVRVSRLAEELNVKPSSVSKMLIKLADYYNTSIDYLVGRTDNKRPVK